MTNYLSLGKKIKIMRIARGLSQGELAQKVEMPQVTLSYVENDHVAPTPDRMKAIKAVLRWPVQAEVAFAILAKDGVEGSES